MRPGFSGIVGPEWAGIAVCLKSVGLWDEDRDAIPEDLFLALRQLFHESVAWNLCPVCREERRKPKECSICGTKYDDTKTSEPEHRGRGLLTGY